MPISPEQQQRLDALRNKQRLAELRAKQLGPTPNREELAGEVTEKEISDISKQYNIPKENLEKAAYAFGASIKGREATPEQMAWAAGGFLGDAIGLGLPQKAFIETREGEEAKTGYDALRQLAEKRKSGLRTAAEIGAGFLLPVGVAGAAARGLGLAGKAATAARAAPIVATPAVEMGAKARRGEELEQAAIGAGLGVGLGAAGLALTKAGKGIARKIAKGAEKRAEKIGALNLDEAIDTKLAETKQINDIEKKVITGRRLDDAERELLEKAGKSPEKVIQDFEKAKKKDIGDIVAEGEEFAAREYDRFLKDKVATEVIEERGLKGQLIPLNLFQRTVLKFSDNKPLFKIFDKRLGTNLEETLDKVSKKHNQYTFQLATSLDKLKNLRNITDRAKVKEEDLYRALDTGEPGNIPEPIIKAWRKFFEEERQAINKLGIPIQKRENYVPKKRLSTVKYISALGREADRLNNNLGIKLGRLDGEAFGKLSKSPEAKPLLAELSFAAGIPIKTAGDANKAFNDIIFNNINVKNKLVKEASAAKERIGEIPDFVLDKSVGNLAGRWVQDTYRTEALRDGLAEFERVAKLASKVDDDFIANHLRTLAADLVGTRTDTLAAPIKDIGQRMLTVAQRKADESTGLRKKVWEGAANSPLFMNMLMRQIYPNYLGLNPKSALQNLASPVLGIVPDMGTGYGLNKYLQAQKDIAATKLKGYKIKLNPAVARRLGKEPGETMTTNNLNLVMQNEGLLPEQWTGEMVEAIQEGIKSGKVTELGKKGLERSTKALMYLFEKSEILARSNAYFMGKRIGKDIVQNPEFAKRFIKRVDSPVYQKRLTQAVRAGDQEKAQRIMVDFLNSNNMFNYDRANMSAYGRFMGPLFSVFSKWPTSIAGRIMTDLYNRGAIAGTARTGKTLAAPFAALAFVDALSDQDSDLSRKIIGQNGLRGWTPIDSMSPLFSEGIGASPAGQSLEAIAKAIRDDKKGSFNRAIQSSLNTYMPTSGWTRFFGEDVPIYMKGKKPKGPVMERRLKEIKKLIKE